MKRENRRRARNLRRETPLVSEGQMCTDVIYRSDTFTIWSLLRINSYLGQTETRQVSEQVSSEMSPSVL